MNWLALAWETMALAGCLCVWPLVGWSAGAALPGESAVHADPAYLIDTWETEDGLPENSATAMAQTPDGYLWFGTFNGLVRFNGVHFEVFNPANTPQLPSEGIVNLHCDRSGRLWVSTYQGWAVLEGAQWRQLRKDDGRAGDYARTITERANGDLLITSFTGKLFEYSRGQLTELPSPPGTPGAGYFGYSDEEGHWWVAQNRFIGRWDGGQWLKMISPPDLPPDAVSCAPARDGGMWLALDDELRKLRRGVEVARVKLPEQPGGIWSLSEDSRGNVWIATRNRGVCRVAPNGAMDRWSATNGWSDHAGFVFEDRENNLWVGTSGAGLMRLKPRRFLRFGLESGLKESLVRSVWPGPDGLWVGTYGQGVFRITDEGVTKVPPADKGIRNPYAQSVLVDRAGRAWVGTFGEALWLIEQQSVSHIPKEQCGGPTVLALFEDSRGRVWVSGSEAIAVFDGTGWHGFGAEQGLPLGGVVGFAEDNNGAIWVSNGSGVFRQEQKRFVEVRAAEGQSLRGITCLKADADGSVWLGSRDRSLLRWRNGRLAALVPTGEFPAKSIRGILDDEKGFFWMTTERGLVRARRGDLHALMDGQTARLRCQIFDMSDGLPRAEFSSSGQPVCARDQRGRLWFATSKGVARIDPAELQLNEAPPPVHIEGISFYLPSPKAGKQRAISAGTSEEAKHWRGPFSSRVSLPAGSRRIAIHYTGLSFAAPEKVRFQVKLEGEDPDWENANTLRAAYYHDLPAKDYLFRVRAANNDNVWNETGTSLAFSVQPFYWQTVWFKLLVSLGVTTAAVGIIWAMIRGKLRQITDRKRAEAEVQRGRAELAHATRVSTMGVLAGSLAHELNQPLTAILSNAQAGSRFLAGSAPDVTEVREVLQDIAQDTKRASEVIRQLRKLVKKDDLQFEALDLNQVIHDVVRLLHSDAVIRKVQVQLDCQPMLGPVHGDGVQLQQVLLNLLLNAFDAMNAVPENERTVGIRTRQLNAGAVQVAVSDRGVGIQPERLARIFEPFQTNKAEGLGLGLSISRSIVEAHGGRLWVENNPDQGVTFCFTVPLDSESVR